MCLGKRIFPVIVITLKMAAGRVVIVLLLPLGIQMFHFDRAPCSRLPQQQPFVARRARGLHATIDDVGGWDSGASPTEEDAPHLGGISLRQTHVLSSDQLSMESGLGMGSSLDEDDSWLYADDDVDAGGDGILEVSQMQPWLTEVEPLSWDLGDGPEDAPEDVPAWFLRKERELRALRGSSARTQLVNDW